MRRLFFAVFLVVACATVAAADSIEKAGHAYSRGDYVQAERLYRSLAEQGDPKAQYFLGVMYANGQGVPQDYKKAMTWIGKAAVQGDAGAQRYLGRDVCQWADRPTGQSGSCEVDSQGRGAGTRWGTVGSGPDLLYRPTRYPEGQHSRSHVVQHCGISFEWL